MKKIGIMYHSGFGHTKKVAETVISGAKEVSGIEVKLITTEQALQDIESIKQYDTLVFGTPTYMGGPSAQFKQFADATAKLWMQGALKNKLAAGFTNSGGLAGDKFATLMYLITFACQHGMIWISLGQPAPLTKSGHGATPKTVNRLDGSLGLMTQSDNADPKNTPAPGDLESAQLFGKRIAEITKKWDK